MRDKIILLLVANVVARLITLNEHFKMEDLFYLYKSVAEILQYKKRRSK